MPGDRKISAREVTTDIRSGMSDAELMEKYKLSAKGLQSLFEKVLHTKLLRPLDFSDRYSSYDHTVVLDDPRSVARESVHFSLPVQDLEHPESQGLIRDLSEMGLRAQGLAVEVGGVTTLVIPGQESLLTDTVVLEAQCTWVDPGESEATPSAGFQIMKVLKGNLSKLVALVRSSVPEAERLAYLEVFHEEEDTTESVDLASLFTGDMTSSGSFSFVGITKTWFGKLLQALPIPALLIDEDLRVSFANQGCEKIGACCDAVQGLPLSCFFPNSTVAEETQSIAERVFSTRKPETYQAILEFGSRRIWGRISFRAVRMGSNRSLMLLIEDLTHEKEQLLRNQAHQEELQREILERKRIEQSLRQSEAKYRELVQSANSIIMRHDTEGRITFFNEFAQSFFGYTLDEITGKNVVGNIVPDTESSRAELAAMMNGIGLHPELYASCERENIRHNGERVWVAWTNRAMTDSNGEILEILCVGNDITERKRSEDAQRLLATAVEQASEGIVITDTDGRIWYANPSFEQISGYVRDEIIGSRLTSLAREAGKTLLFGEWWDSIAGTDVWTGRLAGKRKDGASYLADATVAPVRDVSGGITKYVAVQRDVTKEVELHEQLLQAQKMEAVGVLAGGIAHDFNNLLTVVMGHSELLAARENIDEPVRRDLQKIHRASMHGADLVNRLLTFSRKSEVRPRLLNLNEQIEQLHSLLSRVIPKMIDIELHLSPELDFVNADPGQMEQVLMNLAVNARDAMPEGGRLVIETANVVLENGYSKGQAEAKEDRFVMLSVSDTGHGMDQETREHIFEPFYTTKEKGRGTGLGLAMAYGIVQQHGGQIECESFPGVGTTFKIYLPAAEARPEAERKLDQDLPLSGTETLLLVDDEEDVRDLGKTILHSAGYTIIEATNGDEALEIYRTQGREISLVILDLIMPGMSGRECFQELVRCDPNIKILISSGYGSRDWTADSAPIQAAGFVKKPYSSGELLRAVRSTLDGA